MLRGREIRVEDGLGDQVIHIDPRLLATALAHLLENAAHFIDSEYLHWGNLYEIAPFYALVLILVLKPHGLFGIKDIERV